MVTSIFLYLAFLPAHPYLDPCPLGPRPGPSALSTVPFEEQEPLCLILTDATDEESEQEESGGHELTAHYLAVVGDVGLFVAVMGSMGSSHLLNARDRRRYPRSPPMNGPRQADQRVQASIV